MSATLHPMDRVYAKDLAQEKKRKKWEATNFHWKGKNKKNRIRRTPREISK